MFVSIGRVAECLDLVEDLRDCGPAAGLDDQGNLWLDDRVVDLARAGFLRRLGPDYLEAVERDRLDRCSGVVAAVQAWVEAVATSNGTDHRASLGSIAARVDDLAAYPILTKFVPALLLEALRDAGDHRPPPFPNPSPGGRLSRSLLRLCERTVALGYSPQRLASEWPEVAPASVAAVRAFCHEHTGFGPVNWEAPGMETPHFVFKAMDAAFSGLDPDLLRARADHAPLPEALEAEPSGAGTWAGQLRRALRGWLESMDLQIWYQRAAFYRGILPLLRRAQTWTGGRGDVPVEEFLFAQIDELLDGTVDPAILAQRRAEYWEDADYLGLGGVEPGRLTALMEGW